MEILDYLVIPEKKDYKCYDFLKELLERDENFKQFIIEGIKDGKISGFNNEMWNKINGQNIRRINNFDDVFRDGANLGYCTVASKQLSYSLNNPLICGGILPILAGSKNCTDGSHTWLINDNNVIDTTLMLVMNKEYADKLGYKYESKIDPKIDPVYLAAKEFANDENLKRHV